MDDERVTHTASVSLAFPAAERSVACPSPAPGVVVAILRAAKLVHGCQVLFQRALHVVKEQRFVDHALRTSLGTGAVIREHHDQGIVELAEHFQKLDQSADVVIRYG